MKKVPRIPRVTEARVKPPYGLSLIFDDGLIREINVADDLWGPMFEPLRDPSFFAEVRVDHGRWSGRTAWTSTPLSSMAMLSQRRLSPKPADIRTAGGPTGRKRSAGRSGA